MASGMPGGSSAALDITVGGMTLLRPLIPGPPTLIRHPLSRELCQGIGWFTLAGGLKDSMAGGRAVSWKELEVSVAFADGT